MPESREKRFPYAAKDLLNRIAASKLSVDMKMILAGRLLSAQDADIPSIEKDFENALLPAGPKA